MTAAGWQRLYTVSTDPARLPVTCWVCRGYQVLPAWTERRGRQVRTGWNLVDPDGKWMQTYPTKAESVANIPPVA